MWGWARDSSFCMPFPKTNQRDTYFYNRRQREENMGRLSRINLIVHCSSIFPFMFGVLLYYWDTNILWRIYVLGCPNDFDTWLNKWQSFLPTEPAIGCRAGKPPPLLKHGWGNRRLLSPEPISAWFSNETCSENPIRCFFLTSPVLCWRGSLGAARPVLDQQKRIKLRVCGITWRSSWQVHWAQTTSVPPAAHSPPRKIQNYPKSVGSSSCL